jgi:hypothetical protein
MTPLVLGEEQHRVLAELRELASENPLQMQGLLEKLQDPNYKAAHMAHMSRQTVELPFGFMVTYSIEFGHPAGTCRHMSMSSPVKGRAPSPEAIDMVAELLGFVGGYRACVTWLEDLVRGDGLQKAVNLVQPLAVTADPIVYRT